MKFTKTAVVVAIAGIAAAPMMAAAETTLSGVVQINLQGTDADDEASELQFAAGDVQLNLNAQQAMNSGLTGYANYRLDGGFSGADLTSDSAHLGVKGGFGDIRFGEVNVIADGAEERAGAMNASVGASFGFAGASVAVHYVTKEQGAGDDGTVIAAKVGYGISGVSLALTFSQSEEIAGHETKIRLDAGYDLGGGMGISTRVTSSADNTDATVDDLLEYRVQLTKSF